MTQTTEASTVEVTVPAGTLRRNLSAVLPHASRDDTDLPSLSAVRIEITDGFLYLSATDRYSMAVTRMPLAGSDHQDAEALLPLESARQVRRWLREGREPRTVALSIADSGISLSDEAGLSCRWNTLEREGRRADLRGLVARMAAAPDCPLGADRAVAPKDIARIAKTVRNSSAASLRVTSGGGGKDGESGPVVLVACGDWLIAAFMAMRARSEWGISWESWVPAADAQPEAAGGES